MSSTYGPVLPPGQSPPFAIVTPKDHEVWIFGLACFLFFGAIGGMVRWTTGRGFWTDGFVLYAATTIAVIQSAIILGACSKGLGKGLDLVSTEARDQVQKMYYTSNLFFIMAVGLSKISVMCFLRRISRVRQRRIVFNSAIIRFHYCVDLCLCTGSCASVRFWPFGDLCWREMYGNSKPIPRQ
jgi:hypothetical protein